MSATSRRALAMPAILASRGTTSTGPGADADHLPQEPPPGPPVGGGAVMGRALAAGMLGGALWGVVARVFMRLLSDDPQFSWEGTLGIVGVAALAGASVGLVHAARVTGRSRWWRLAALPGLLLFAGPGSLLLPTTVGMAAVLRGRPVVRALGVVVAMVPLVVLAGNEPPLPPTQVTGLTLMVASCAPLGWALGEVVRRWRPRQVPAPKGAREPAPEVVPA